MFLHLQFLLMADHGHHRIKRSTNLVEFVFVGAHCMTHVKMQTWETLFVGLFLILRRQSLTEL